MGIISAASPVRHLGVTARRGNAPGLQEMSKSGHKAALLLSEFSLTDPTQPASREQLKVHTLPFVEVCSEVVSPAEGDISQPEPLCPERAVPHLPLERPDKGVRCVLHGSPSVLERIVTSEGCAKGNTLCLSVSGLLLKPDCVWYLSSAADLQLHCSAGNH